MSDLWQWVVWGDPGLAFWLLSLALALGGLVSWLVERLRGKGKGADVA